MYINSAKNCGTYKFVFDRLYWILLPRFFYIENFLKRCTWCIKTKEWMRSFKLKSNLIDNTYLFYFNCLVENGSQKMMMIHFMKLVIVVNYFSRIDLQPLLTFWRGKTTWFISLPQTKKSMNDRTGDIKYKRMKLTNTIFFKCLWDHLLTVSSNLVPGRIIHSNIALHFVKEHLFIGN